MAGKFDPKEFAAKFEIIIDGIGAEEGLEAPGESMEVTAEARCSGNYGQPCSDASNRSCPKRGLHVTHCDEEGVWWCPKVNNQGCHGSGRVCVNFSGQDC